MDVGEDNSDVSMLCSSAECTPLVNFGNKGSRTLLRYCKIHKKVDFKMIFN